MNWKNPEEVKEYKRIRAKKYDKKKKAESDRNWLLKNKNKPEYKLRRSNNLKKYRKNNKDKIRQSQKTYRLKQRLTVINYYSKNNPKCSCCGEVNINFLTIDHINGNGRKHRKSLKGETIYFILIKNNFPDGYQVLCYNCNLSKSNKSKCYHQRSLEYKKPNKARRNYINRKKKILIHYSSNPNPFCRCCGENEISFLGIDHIYGNGNEHLKKIGGNGGVTLQTWLIRNNFPEGFQVLCNNCNCGKRTSNHCPHQNQPKTLNINNL